MIQFFLSLFLTIATFHAQAQVFNGRNPNCEAPNQQISVQDFQKILEVSESINGCDVYETQYVENLSTQSWVSEDDYNGPLLFIKMIQNESINNFTMSHDVFVIRADQPLCLERNGHRETISYKLDTSRGDGPIDFLFNIRTISRRIYFEFTDAKLNMAEQEIIRADGGAWGNMTGNRSREVFKCGALSPVDVAPAPATVAPQN